nr:soluble scavenger receptor cysteine-rich domain-containing protein SSC5D-like [Anolis sagrei ordinatus]
MMRMCGRGKVCTAGGRLMPASLFKLKIHREALLSVPTASQTCLYLRNIEGFLLLPFLPIRHESSKKENHSPKRRTSGSSPKRSRRSSSSHARRRTRSRSRSPRYYRAGKPRSRSRERSRSRKRSRSRERSRSRMPSRSRVRSRSPRRPDRSWSPVRSWTFTSSYLRRYDTRKELEALSRSADRASGSTGRRLGTHKHESSRTSSRESSGKKRVPAEGEKKPSGSSTLKTEAASADAKEKPSDAAGEPSKAGTAAPRKEKKSSPVPENWLLSSKAWSCGTVLHISDLPDDGYTEQDITKIVQPFGKVSSILVLHSKKEVQRGASSDDANKEEARERVVERSSRGESDRIPDPIQDLRLMNGTSPCSGRVEVFHNDTWVTICDAGWDLQDAQVVCRELGCGNASKALGGAHYGQGSGPIWLESINCTGEETFLKECQKGGWGEHSCSHSQDASVVCSDLRLMNGTSPCSGRVEVFHNDTWGTICDAGWDLQDAQVVCSQLGCGDAPKALGGAHYGQGSGPIWLESINCTGEEASLKECQKGRWGEQSCSHSQDASVECSAVESSLEISIHLGVAALVFLALVGIVAEAGCRRRRKTIRRRRRKRRREQQP